MEDAEGEAAELRNALSELVRAWSFRERDRAAAHDASATQAQALDSLVRRGPMTLNEFAAALYLDKSTASRVATGLERKGLVRRRGHPEDRRALLLELTPEGRELQAGLEREALAEERAVLREIEPDARERLLDVVEALTRATAARVDTSGGSCTRIVD